ncbi:DUF3440 domain-containing protein [Listeria grayi]|uniref:DUF3440 domain-containing protein n=1 Tax=Listeria grayi TaxID=1641 RepID=UPI001623CE6D|nr:DUF3440 domain-containing protein [Listeria grayi]MBC1921402.1 DUF3440 domain-containing protein [Listeria grayi]
MNVLEAAQGRMHYIFQEFEHVYFSVSGGKDSGIMVYLANQIAQKMNRIFDIVILDIEANYTETVIFLERCKQLPNVGTVYHFCLPFYEDNYSSILQPQWIMWNPREKERWIHPLPQDAITLDKLDERLLYYFNRSHGNPDIFLKKFGKWYQEIHADSTIACGIGLRTQESLMRYNAIQNGINKYRGKQWINRSKDGYYKFYPIFDWKFEDIWKAVSCFDWEYNHIYDQMYKNGIPFKHMRICQPYGLQQRIGLKQFAALEPHLWEKIVNRVSGANFGSLYSKTHLLGYAKTKKPLHMTWQQYTVFLLESYGFYSEKLRDHYHRKFKILMNYYKKKYDMDVCDMVDEAKQREWKKDERLWHNWKSLARVLEKNDFALTTRQYSLTKKDEQELYQLYDEFHGQLGIEALNGKIYQSIINKMQHETSK